MTLISRKEIAEQIKEKEALIDRVGKARENIQKELDILNKRCKALQEVKDMLHELATLSSARILSVYELDSDLIEEWTEKEGENNE